MCILTSPSSVSGAHQYLRITVLSTTCWWLRQQRTCLQCGRPRFNPLVGEITWRRKWLPPVKFLSGKSYGQKSQTRLGDFHFHSHFWDSRQVAIADSKQRMARFELSFQEKNLTADGMIGEEKPREGQPGRNCHNSYSTSLNKQIGVFDQWTWFSPLSAH